MKETLVLQKLRPGPGISETGNKANSLLFLQRHNFRIPVSYLLTASCQDDYLRDSTRMLSHMKKEFSSLPDLSYAIRSSTTLEDSADFTFAGQFQTFTNVSGVDNLVKAVLDVWESSRTLGDTEYRKMTSRTTARCAVIIQEMVESRLAGVSFSKNPISEQPETIVEAVEGQGEQLVQKGVVPLRWRFRNGYLLEGPDNHEYFGIIKRIADDTRRIRSLFGKHVDIEWAYDGKDLYYLQVRPVTGTRRINIYSNKMAKEMLPGQIKPLVWSVNIPVVNGTWINILREILGNVDIRPEDLAKQFYFRTYFNVAALSRIFGQFGMSSESLEMLLLSKEETRHSFRPGFGTIRHVPRIVMFVIRKLGFEKTFRKEFEMLTREYEVLSKKIEGEFDISDYNNLCDELFRKGRRLTYLSIFAPMFMQLHNKRLSKRLKKLGIEYDAIDFSVDFPELENYSPVVRMNRIREKLGLLPGHVRERCSDPANLRNSVETSDIAADFESLIRDFGHFSESGNDFSMVKWKDDPEQVLKLILNSDQSASRSAKLTFSDLLQKGIAKRSPVARLYRKAGVFKLYREQISSLFIFGHGQFRYLFLNVGRELASRNIISTADDIFYLYKHEVDLLLAGEHHDAGSVSDLVESRKREMDLTKDYVLPSVIYGEVAPILETGKVKNHYGVATSSGSFTGTTRVIKGTSDFAAVSRGDILLIPFSDVSWTPVLSLAGAIVSETGGLLSHCSIIAREMGIPALVSVENACALGNGLKATVDGSNGILTIHDYE